MKNVWLFFFVNPNDFDYKRVDFKNLIIYNKLRKHDAYSATCILNGEW